MPTPTIGNVLQALDVVVVASHREGCSLAMIEAWTAGVPVVATPVGGLPELQAKYGQLAIEVPMDPSPKALADAIVRAAGPEGLAIAKHAGAIAAEHFSVRTMADHWGRVSGTRRLFLLTGRFASYLLESVYSFQEVYHAAVRTYD
jgi:glycosyltransferase involved in cell wall biosynthesis